MKIPFLDLGRLHESIRDELDDAINGAIEQSAFINGPAVTEFEAAFADAHGRQHGVGCASGTDALSLALASLGLRPGDEVIVPSMTFFATAEAVVSVGGTPVLADVDEESLLLGPDQVAAVRTDRTRAVLPVHLYGHVVPFTHVEEWIASGLIVVEDAAQAHLATWHGRPVGDAGHAACFSFFPGKNLGALGDAGAVVTDDAEVASTIRRQRDHGRVEKYIHAEFGTSSRLDALQARVLQVKLAHLRAWTDRRRELAARYREGLAGMEGVAVVPWEDGAVHHLLVVRVATNRDAIAESLTAAGIGTGVHYPVPLSLQPPFASRSAACPASERAAREVLSLPTDPLMTSDEVDAVVAAIRDAVQRS